MEVVKLTLIITVIPPPPKKVNEISKAKKEKVENCQTTLLLIVL